MTATNRKSRGKGGGGGVSHLEEGHSVRPPEPPGKRDVLRELRPPQAVPRQRGRPAKPRPRPSRRLRRSGTPRTPQQPENPRGRVWGARMRGKYASTTAPSRASAIERLQRFFYFSVSTSDLIAASVERVGCMSREKCTHDNHALRASPTR